MKRVTRNGVIAVAAASGAMAVAFPAQAAFAVGGSSAGGGATGSPGLISGNTIQLPVDVPVNACGNTVNVVGLLNPAAGNTCAAESAGGDAGAGQPGGAPEGATAEGGSQGSPGLLSGNGVQLPVELPVTISGNSVNVVGVGNAATGNESDDRPGPRKPPAPPERPEPPVEPPVPGTPEPPARHTPAPAPPAPAPPGTTASLAHTGTDATLPVALGAGALILGGAALYRRHRPGAAR
ncbi:chaplin [Streptomyces sp. NPDC048290]|uniref:chaplin n=1 Tax=Streptomyces sp. NPDC048290 TaxID=3155811 RepID=UPI0034260A03